MFGCRVFRGDRERNSTLATFRGDNEEKEAVRGDSAPILGLVGAETWMSFLLGFIRPFPDITLALLRCAARNRFGMDFISDYKLNKP